MMEINLKGMKVVHGERIYRALAIVGWSEERPDGEGRESCRMPKRMAVMALNEDGQVILLEDEAWRFQFLTEQDPIG